MLNLSFNRSEDRKFLSIVLTKQDGKEWWKYVVKGEPEIDTRKAEPEPSFIADLDPETRSTVDKVMVRLEQYPWWSLSP